jgi:hypothetical protein
MTPEEQKKLKMLRAAQIGLMLLVANIGVASFGVMFPDPFYLLGFLAYKGLWVWCGIYIIAELRYFRAK